MSLFSKKKKKEDATEAKEPPAVKKTDPKPKSDKAIKPRAPNTMFPKQLIRIVVWLFIGFVFIKGLVSCAQGTRIIENYTTVGSNEPTIADNVKGFASDFAAEYFTWEADKPNERIERLANFITGIEQDAGLKAYNVKGSSRVISAEVYASEKINDKQFDITVVIRRTVELSADASITSKPDQTTKAEKTIITDKTYMVVPVTITANGLLIHSYPRFIAEQEKGQKEESIIGQSVNDILIVDLGTELAASFLQSYFEGNVSQLKYYYADHVKPPEFVAKSAFSLEKIESVNIYQINAAGDLPKYYRIDASVIVKSSLGETFTNMWTINATEKDGRLYVLFLGQNYDSKTDINQQQTTEENGSENQPETPASIPPITTNE